MGRITCKFGGTSLASAEQIRKSMDIVRSDSERRFVVPSAPGKRHAEDIKVTDSLIGWFRTMQSGLNPQEAVDIVTKRFVELAAELDVDIDFESELKAISEESTGWKPPS